MQYKMRKLLFLLFISAFFSCETSVKKSEGTETVINDAASSNQENISADSVIRFLLNATVSDFSKNMAPDSLSFRNVRSGYVAENGQKHYILCGEYRGSTKGDSWTQFTTVKTSDYELWLGHQSGIYCDDSTAVWTHEEDLASRLQNQLERLR